MASIAVWVALLGLAQVDAPAATVISAEEAAAALRQSVATGAVDTLMKSVDVLGGKASVAMLHRTQPEATALVHDQATEVYYILEGSGTLVTGGSLKDPRTLDLARLAAGTSRTGERVGGEGRKVVPRDMIIIPAGTPHGFSQLDGPISYLVYRFWVTGTPK